jgi:hypothetical protein
VSPEFISQFACRALRAIVSVAAIAAMGVAPATAGTTPQTITFAVPAAHAFGAAPFAVTATASSGLAVTVASLTAAVCKVTGMQVSIIAAGTCTLRATQAGDATYAAASQVDRAFTIAKTSQAITFVLPASATYGDAAIAVSATASSKLAVTLTSTTPSFCTVAAGALKILGAGSCVVQATQAGNGNYIAAPVLSRTLKIAKASQSITLATLAGRTFGGAPFAITPTATSKLAVTLTSLTTAVCSVVGTTVTLAAAGTCTLRAAQAGDANFNAATAITRSFTVAKAAQTITFVSPAAHGVADAPFSVVASASSGLAVAFTSATTTVCIVSGTTVTIVAAGTCTLTANQSGNANYLAATAVKRSFTIGKAAQTVTFAAIADRAIDQPAFALVAASSSGLAVSFASLTAAVCKVTGATLTPLTVGICTVRASQAGNAAFAAAAAVDRSFNIGRAAQTIAFAVPANKTFGDAPFTVSAIASSALAVTISSSTPAVCSAASGIVTLVGAGGCSLHATQGGDARYAPAPPVDGSIVVAKASQTIAFTLPTSRAITDPPLTLTATTTSNLVVALASATPTVCTVTSGMATMLKAGSCRIDASQAGNANFNAAPTVSRTMTVDAAAQVITFDAIADQTLAASPVTLHASATSGLTVAIVSTTPLVCTVNGTMSTLVAKGTCTLRATQAGDATYPAASPVTRSFAVLAVPQTITFPPIADHPLGDIIAVAAATASSGLPVRYAAIPASACTSDGSATIRLVAAGTCSITASQPGDARYAAAPDFMRTFAIVSGTSRVSIVAIGPRTTASPPFGVSATSAAGLRVIVTAGPASVCTAAGTDVSMAGVGECVVTAFETADGVHAQGTPAYARFPVLAAPAFAAAQTYAVGPWPSTVAIGRFHAPDAVDAVVPAQARMTRLRGDGRGGFTIVADADTGPLPTSTSSAVGDFNGDGIADFAFSGIFNPAVAVHLGQADGSFALSPTQPGVDAPGEIVALDVDADGVVDLVVANIDSGGVEHNTITFLHGGGDGTFTPTVTLTICGNPSGLAVADFNSDGIADIAVACGRDNVVAILAGRQGGGFVNAGSIPVASPYRVTAVDVDDDGTADLIVSSMLSQVFVARNLGDGRFGTPSIAGEAVQPGTMQVVDVNGDGTADIVLAESTANAIAVLAGAGDGRFAPPLRFAAGNYPAGLDAADVDGDGRIDLVYANMLDGTASIVRNATSGRPIAHVIGVPPLSRSAPSGRPFKDPLAVRISDANDVPIGGIEVRFTLPGSKAGAAFFDRTVTRRVVTDRDGIALSPELIAGPDAARYVAFADAPGGRVEFELENLANGGAPQFVTTTLPDGIVGASYVVSLVATGSPVPTFSIASGTLPAGLALSPGGSISGTPTAVGNSSVTFRAQNGHQPDALLAVTLTVAGRGQTITFDTIADVPITTRTVSTVVAASSGLAVSLASITPATCTMSGAAVQLVAAGRCTIRASQPGNAQFPAAPNVDRSFAILRGKQAVMLALPDVARIGDAPLKALSTSTSGLATTLASATPLVCSVVDGTYVRFLARGTCSLHASQTGDASYEPASADVSFAVRGALQTVDFPSPSHGRYDEYTYVLATASSGLPVTFESRTPEVCAIYFGNAVGIGTAKEPTSTTCTIAALQAGNDRFDPASAIQSFAYGIDFSLFDPPVPLSPHIVYATYLGGLGFDQAFGVAMAPDGGPIVAGIVGSTNFPGLSSQAYANAGLGSVFVAKLQSQTGTVARTAAAGIAQRITQRAEPDIAALHAMAVDAAGNAYVITHGGSAEFPQRGGAYEQTGPLALFRIDTAGRTTTLVSALDPAIKSARALAIDASGAIYFTGSARSGLATTAGAAIGRNDSTFDIPYLAKFTASGSLQFATYLTVPGTRLGSGKPGADQATRDSTTMSHAVAVDAAGNAYVVGQSMAADFPATPGALDTADHNNRDAFIVKVNAAGTALLFVARLGFDDAERATSVALAPDGSIVVAGKTASAGTFEGKDTFQYRVRFSQNNYQTFWSDREFGFLAKLDPTASTVIFLAAIGAVGGDLVQLSAMPGPSPLPVAVDPNGDIYVAGMGFPDRTLPLVQNLTGVPESGAFLMKISSGGSHVYSTFLGDGKPTGVAADGFGNAYVIGMTKGIVPTANTAMAGCGFQDPTYCIMPFVFKVNDATYPVDIIASPTATVDEGTTVSLRATVGDSRAAGVVDFSDDGMTIATVDVARGVATLSRQPALGFHHFAATFRGSGYANGMSSVARQVVVRQVVTP